MVCVCVSVCLAQRAAQEIGRQSAYPSHTHRKTCEIPHKIHIPTEPRNPPYPYSTPRVFSLDAFLTRFRLISHPQNSHRPMGIHHSPHTHPMPVPMGIPVGIPISTAALWAHTHTGESCKDDQADQDSRGPRELSIRWTCTLTSPGEHDG